MSNVVLEKSPAEVEQDQRPELYLGHFEIEYMPLKYLIRLTQVRENHNSKTTSIKNSILRRLDNPNTQDQALIHPVSVARLDYSVFNEYIDAVNGVWGSGHNIDDYETFDGYYHLVVAGHTRIQSATQVENEKEAKILMPCVISKNLSVDDILSTQLDENTFEEPPQERRAMAMVQYYNYGLKIGLWSNSDEFIKQVGKNFDSKALNQALCFAELPPRIRDFVFVKKSRLPYSVACLMGSAKTIIREYHLKKLSDEGGNVEHALSSGMVDEWIEASYGMMVANLQKSKHNITTAKNFINQKIKDMEEAIGYFQTHIPLSCEMASPDALLEEYSKFIWSEYSRAVSELADPKLEALRRAVPLHQEIFGRDDEYQKRVAKKTIVTLGAVGLLCKDDVEDIGQLAKEVGYLLEDEPAEEGLFS